MRHGRRTTAVLASTLLLLAALTALAPAASMASSGTRPKRLPPPPTATGTTTTPTDPTTPTPATPTTTDATTPADPAPTTDTTPTATTPTPDATTPADPTPPDPAPTTDTTPTATTPAPDATTPADPTPPDPAPTTDTTPAATTPTPDATTTPTDTPTTPPPADTQQTWQVPPGVVWTADADAALAAQWSAGNAFDVLAGIGTLMNDAAWSLTSRVRQVADPVAQGAAAYALTVEAADHDFYTATAQRTELGQNNPTRVMPDGVDRQMRAGEERWIAYQVRIPADFPNVNAWCEIQQNKGAGIGNGPLSIGFRNGRLALEKSLSQAYGSVDLGVVWSSAPVVRDQWLKLMIHVKWSLAGDGFYELFGDLADGAGFHQIVPLTPGWTLKLGADGVSPVTVGSRIGIYRLAQPVTSTIYFDGFTVASNRDAATISAFGRPL